MLEFGKKTNYRPLLISVALAAVVATFAQNIFQNKFVTIAVAIFFFTVPFFLNYFINIPWEFQYWQVNSDSIRYTDVFTRRYRLLAMLFPPATRYNTIMKHDIASVTVLGDLNAAYSLPPAILYNVFNASYDPAIQMAHNQDYVRVFLKDGHTVDLRFSRDYIYDRAKTIDKLQQLVTDLAKDDIKVTLPPIHASARPKLYN